MKSPLNSNYLHRLEVGGDAVVIIDADLQDPPELIPALVEQWRAGYDDVYARRLSRDGESFLKHTTAALFYRVMRRFSEVDIPPDTGDFRLLSRRAADALRQVRERHRFMKGLFNWVGFERTEVVYRRQPRAGGRSKWNYWRLWNFALEGITSHTRAPIRLASYLGILVAFSAFLYAIFIAYDKLVHGNPVDGYPSLMVALLFLGGVQLLGSGVVMVFDDQVDVGDILIRIASFFRDESCGQCVPCRIGTMRQEEALHRLVAARTAGARDAERALIADLARVMRDASICGLGQTAASAVESALHKWVPR